MISQYLVINYPELVDKLVLGVSISRPNDQAKACLTHYAYDKLHKITCPTLILGGDSNNVVGGIASREMAERIKDSKLILYQGLGHGAYEETKDFNKEVFNFLES